MIIDMFTADATASGYLLCAVVYPLAALAAWRSRLEGLRKLTMVICCLATSLWAVAKIMAPLSLLAALTAVILEILRSSSWLLFFTVSLGAKNWLLQRLHVKDPVAKLGLGAFLVVILGGFVSVWVMGFGPGVIIAFWQITVSVVTLLLLENLLRNCDDASRWGVQLICLGAGLLVVYDLFFYASLLGSAEFDPRFTAARGFLVAAGAPFLIVAMISGKSWRGDIALSRNMVFHSAALAGAGFYLVTTSIAGEYLKSRSGSWGTAFEMAFLVAAVMVLVVVLQSASVRARLMVFISKHFFRLKYDYRAVWLGFIRQMADPDTQQNLHQRALRAVADAMACRSGALWVLQHPVDAYTPMATWNMTDGDFPMIPADDELPKFLIQSGWIIDIQQCITDPPFYGGLEAPVWLAKLPHAWIVIPLIHNQVLEAFLVLGNPRSGPQPLAWEDFDLLKTVGAQAASYLAEERAARELVDARRMADLNRRFAFILHDIKNVVSQMGMMLQNAERFGDNPDFQKDMLVTVRSSVDRLRGMLVQLGSERTPNRLQLRSFDLLPVVQNVADRWQRSVVGLELVASAEPITVTGSDARLMNVLDHLIQNAVDATGPTGKIRIEVKATGADGIVEVVDNGPGMTPEFIRDQLFRPLETSKPTGSGLGAFQALKTVRDMGGRLDVDSQYGKGTTMRVILRRNLTPLKIPTEIASADAF